MIFYFSKGKREAKKRIEEVEWWQIVRKTVANAMGRERYTGKCVGALSKPGLLRSVLRWFAPAARMESLVPAGMERG